MGNDGVVVELQHSPISPEEIVAREAFYGDMVWLFDATRRFSCANQGERAFFSFGRTKHIERCAKPVFLDFGWYVVDIERFTDAITMVSGYGRVRSRAWFAERFLSNVRQPGTRVEDGYTPEATESDPWAGKSPIWKLKHDTKWIDPRTSREVTFPKWSEYINLNYYRYTVGDSQNRRYDYDTLVECHPEIANGWTKSEFQRMKEFLGGTAIIIGGLLRILPLPATVIRVARTVTATEHLLASAEDHIRAGRLPVLQESTKRLLVEKAKEHELKCYGHLLQPDKRETRTLPQSLFD